MFTKSRFPPTAIERYHSILAARQDAYNKTLGSGRYEPFIYPFDVISAGLLFLALLIIPRLAKQRQPLARIAAFIWIIYFCLRTMLRARCLGFANGYGIGLMCSWGMIMTVALLFCNDVSTDFQRIEWRDSKVEFQKHSNGSANGTATGAEVSTSQTSQRIIYESNGSAVNNNSNQTKRDKAATRPYTLVWQGYPTSILHCMEWTAELITTFRGVGWNWRIPTAPPLDIPIEDPSGKTKPRNSASTSSPKSTSITIPTLRRLQLTGLRDFLIHYLVLDFLKTIMITDPYFMGTASLSSPSPWPILSNETDSLKIILLTYITRLTLSLAGVLSALTFIFSLSPLTFLTLLPTLIPPIQLRKLIKSPLLEPMLYPPAWGPLQTIQAGGLSALWGKTWHQLFRFGISEPSRALIAYFNLDRKSPPARLLQLFIAFGLSGFIHASASFTTFSASHPLSGPMAFFLLQAVGIVLQQQLTMLVKNNLYFAYRVPWLQSTANSLFTLLWLFLTGPLLANDFARCGVWLFEPVPISLLRGLLWGQWWAWRNLESWLGWYRDPGGVWWKSGIAIY